MTILVTAATGQLGRLVVESLLKKVPAEQIAVAVRSPEKAADLAALGVQVRQADYAKPETLGAALAGVDKVLLISGTDMGERVGQHQAVIDAAKEAGVSLLAYTSVLGGDDATFALADDHKATEAAVRASGIPFVLLRHGWYTENYTAQLGTFLEHGAVVGSSGDGRVASATRQDFAEAAAAVLAGEGHANTVYELSGDTAWSFSEFAAAVSAQAGKPVVYQDLAPGDHLQVLLGAGLPAPLAEVLVDVDAGIGRGDLAHTPGDLSRLIGRPTTPLADSITSALHENAQ
ncbi:NAD(P)H dehydrogenase (quinone) [Streptacidiphilus sp. MAP12-16]|uniref:SDR family oxidoreductase n=1 Tax=Streptacidiphilus sp. MAP12-16 TaxID=3156300 RepID=UPI003517E3A0